jgi:hypothetical protein
LKAIYLARKKGEIIPGMQGPHWKTGALVIKSRPILLTLNISADMKLKHDSDWGDAKTGLMYCGTDIPPSHIVKVEVLEHDTAI